MTTYLSQVSLLRLVIINTLNAIERAGTKGTHGT